MKKLFMLPATYVLCSLIGHSSAATAQNTPLKSDAAVTAEMFLERNSDNIQGFSSDKASAEKVIALYLEKAKRFNGDQPLTMGALESFTESYLASSAGFNKRLEAATRRLSIGLVNGGIGNDQVLDYMPYLIYLARSKGSCSDADYGSACLVGASGGQISGTVNGVALENTKISTSKMLDLSGLFDFTTGELMTGETSQPTTTAGVQGPIVHQNIRLATILQHVRCGNWGNITGLLPVTVVTNAVDLPLQPSVSVNGNTTTITAKNTGVFCPYGSEVLRGYVIANAQVQYAANNSDTIHVELPFWFQCAVGDFTCTLDLGICDLASYEYGADFSACIRARWQPNTHGVINTIGTYAENMIDLACYSLPGAPALINPAFISSSTSTKYTKVNYGTNYQIPGATGAAATHLFPTPTDIETTIGPVQIGGRYDFAHVVAFSPNTMFSSGFSFNGSGCPPGKQVTAPGAGQLPEGWDSYWRLHGVGYQYPYLDFDIVWVALLKHPIYPRLN